MDRFSRRLFWVFVVIEAIAIAIFIRATIQR
jgi:hypothetical protein